MLPTSAPTSADNAQRLVARWMTIVFLCLALVLVAGTWWRHSRACRATCAAQGEPNSRLVFKGGGRLEPGVQCVCGAPAAR